MSKSTSMSRTKQTGPGTKHIGQLQHAATSRSRHGLGRQSGRYRHAWPGAPAGPDYTPAAGAGSSASEQIRWVQYMLNNVMGTNLPTDGIPSADTRAAIRNFQSQHGLPVSGFAGPDTIAALQSASGPQSGGDAPQGGELEFWGQPYSTHMAGCRCPRCRSRDFEFETLEIGESQEVLGELEEMGLAMELLHVQNDSELEQFLGNLIHSVGRGLKAVGSFAAQKVMPVLGPALKQIAKAALPIAGGALGSLIPIPGVGTALGGALGGMVANALEMEVAGLDHEDADIERARRFVRLAASAIRQAATALGTDTPENVARAALVSATTRHLPSTAAVMAALMPLQGQVRPGLAATSPMTGKVPTASSPSLGPTGQSGTWRQAGSHIVVEGL